jgi:peptidylprolyl isomerase
VSDLNSKPEIDFIDGPPPSELVIEDIVVGEGAEASPGDRVTVHYVGVDFESGEQFDASWDRGESITFPLAGLIAGWQEGIPGMKVGGRRQLVIPPALAYGESGGHRLSGRTLVFIIDLLGVG